MADSKIRIVIEAEDRNAKRTIQGVGDALTNMGSRAGGISGSLSRVFEFAGGQLVADGIRNIASSLVDLGGQALDSYASFERLQMSLQTFSARELINAGVTNNMQDALAMSTERAKELQGWIEKLAVESPFNSADIANAFRLAQAYGFTSDQAMRLTQATVDFAAGAGISGAMMDRISLALGQIQARGKVSAQELNQLSEAGINARQILADAFGVSTASITGMIEKGLVPANLAIEAITQSLETDFGGAAQRQANTFSGLISSLEDLKSIGLREFFTGTFQAIQPLLIDFVSTVTDPTIKSEIRAWGDAFGQNVAAGVRQVSTAVAAFRSGGLTGLAQALQIPQPIISALSFAAQNINILKGALLGLSGVLAAGAVVAGLTAVGAALAALVSPIGLITLGAMALGAAWQTNFGGIQEKTQAVIEFLRPGFAELLSWISAASQGNFAPLQAGLQGALQSVNATIQAFRWEDFVTKLGDWGAYIAPIAWDALVTAVDWATYIGQLTWSSAVVPALDWAAYVAPLAWSGFVATLFDWGAYITSLNWTSIITTSIDWATWIVALPWNMFVAVLDWSVWLGAFAWSNYVSHLDWSTVVTTLTWSNFVTALSNWGAYVAALPWGSYITTLNNWGQFVSSVAWSSFVSNLNWPSFVQGLSWQQFVGAVDWSTWITAVDWAGFIVALSWSVFVPSLSWSAFVSAIDLASYIPSFPGWSVIFGGINPFGGTSTAEHHAAGTSSFKGGLTWVDEKGAELFRFPDGSWAMGSNKGAHLVNLPAGTQIYPHEDAQKMMGAAGLTAVGQNATGTTRAPAVWPGGGASFGDLSQAQALGARFGNTAGGAIKSAMKKATDELKAALSSVPGLFNTSQVTQQQMDLAKLGVPQNFADDWIRHLTDEVVNGVNWSDADIQDAAVRAGIDPTLPAKAILELVKQKWNDSSFFAGGKNTDLINQDAVRAAMQQQADAKSGQQALYALFGITPEQAQGQAVALGGMINTGVAQGMAGTGGQSVGAQFVNNLATGITPETMAPVATQITSGIVSNMTTGGDKEQQEAGSSIGTQIANAVVAQLTNSDALTGAGQAILQKIVDSWATIGNIDIGSKIAAAMTFNLGTADAIQVLQDVGKKIFKLVYQGYDAAAAGADYVAPVASAVNGAQAQGSGGGNASATTTVTPPTTTTANTTTSSSGSGKSFFPNMALAGAGGVTVNVYANVGSQLDVVSLAYQVADVIQKRSRR